MPDALPPDPVSPLAAFATTVKTMHDHFVAAGIPDASACRIIGAWLAAQTGAAGKAD